MARVLPLMALNCADVLFSNYSLMPKARYSLYVLKVPLNNKQTNKQTWSVMLHYPIFSPGIN